MEYLGGRAVQVALDLRSLAGVKEAVAEVFDACGRLDALINNAGVTLRKSALDVTVEDWETVMRTNVSGTFFLCQEVGRRLVEPRAPARIINIASTHGIVGFPDRTIYGMSKAALIQMTRMLAIEWLLRARDQTCPRVQVATSLAKASRSARPVVAAA